MTRFRPERRLPPILAAITVLSALALNGPGPAAAALEEIAGMSYNVNTSIADNLKALTGKKVFVTMDSGTILAGTVKAVGKGLLHLQKLDGKEFFDALVRIDDISAVDTRFRDYQR